MSNYFEINKNLQKKLEDNNNILNYVKFFKDDTSSTMVNYIAASATEPTTSDLIIYTLKQKFLKSYASKQTKSWIDVFC